MSVWKLVAGIAVGLLYLRRGQPMSVHRHRALCFCRLRRQQHRDRGKDSDPGEAANPVA
jgi:hypothetical protein